MFVLLMASFCGKAGPLGDCTPRCAATCSCLVSSRLRQTWEKAQPLPGVVLGEKNLFTGAESLSLCEDPPAHSVVFPELTVGSSVAVRAPPRRVLRGSASPGSSSRRSVPTGGHGPWDTASPHSASPELSTPPAGSTAGTTACRNTHPWQRCTARPCRSPATPRSCVSPQKPIHFCGCPRSPQLDDAGIRVLACFFFLSLLSGCTTRYWGQAAAAKLHPTSVHFQTRLC